MEAVKKGLCSVAVRGKVLIYIFFKLSKRTAWLLELKKRVLQFYKNREQLEKFYN